MTAPVAAGRLSKDTCSPLGGSSVPNRPGAKRRYTLNANYSQEVLRPHKSGHRGRHANHHAQSGAEKTMQAQGTDS